MPRRVSMAMPSVGRDTLVAPGAAARIAAAAQGTAHAPAASLPPAPGSAVTAVTAGRPPRPGLSPRSSASLWPPRSAPHRNPRRRRPGRQHHRFPGIRQPSPTGPPGSPVMVTRTRHYAAGGKLIEYAETTTVAGRWRGRAYAISGS